MTKIKILVVDDQIDVAESIKNTLEHLGYAVPAIAYYGQEAIKLAGEMRPDLILMDIKLAGNLDGVEAAAAIQSRLDVPVVYLTAYADDQTLQRAQVTEPFGYILKPFTSRELHSAISIALYKHAIEHRLKKSEARYRAVVEDQTELISRYRPDYVLTFVNEAHCRYFSKTRQELLGHSFMPLLPEKDQERVAKHLATFSLQNPVGVIEHRAVLPGGEIRWQQWSDRAIFDDEGRLIEFQSVGRDITALKQAEKELHRRDGILQAVAFASEYLLRLADLDAGIPEALARLGAATGASRAYVFENHPGERSPLLASRWYEWLAPKVTSRLDSPRHQDILLALCGFDRWKETLGQSKILHGPVREFPPDEREILQARNIQSIVVVPIFVEEEWWGIIGFDECMAERLWSMAEIRALRTAADVLGAAIQRKRSEESLRDSRERYRTIAELGSDFAYSFQVGPDNALTLEWVTDAFTRITGFSRDQIPPDVNLLSFVHKGDKGAIERHYQVLFSGQAHTEEFRIITRSGETRWLHIDSRPTWGAAQGRVVRVVGAARDITRRKQVEEQIKAALEEKEVLLQEIHHRVKNNLQIVASLLDLQCASTEDEKTHAIFEDSRNRVISMALVHERLYRTPNLAQIDLANYARELATILSNSLAAPLSAVSFAVKSRNAFLDIDKAIPCGLVITELVSNCLKHAFLKGRAGEIHIGLYRNNPEFTLIISDNGIGLPADMDFRNTESLGLQLVTMLTDQLDGTIELDRKSGTTFKIVFPIV